MGGKVRPLYILLVEMEFVISIDPFRKIEFVILSSHLSLFSPHPYIFFNRPNNDTMTFLGFRVDENGNLLDPETEEIIQEGLMTRHLRTGLHVQRVDLNNNFESYSKYVSYIDYLKCKLTI